MLKCTMQCVLLHSVLQVVKEYFELLRIDCVIFSSTFLQAVTFFMFSKLMPLEDRLN